MVDDQRYDCATGLHFVMPRREPVFHAVGHDGTHLLTTLDIVKVWCRQVITQGYDFDAYYFELYVGMPDETGLRRCDLGLAGTSKKPKMTVSAPGIPGVLWTCDL